MAVPFSGNAYLGYSITTIILFIFGVTSQIIALFVFTRNTYRQIALNKLFINLAVANLIMILWGFPLVIISGFHQEWVFGQPACIATGFMTGVTNIAMIITLVCIQSKVLHLINITGSYRLYKFLGSTNENKLILSIWIYSAACMIPTTVGWSDITLEPGGINCAPNWTARAPKDIAYLALLTFLAYVIPVGLQIHSVTMISWRSPNRQRESGTSGIILRNRAVYRSKAKMVLASTITFTLLWLPYCLCSVITLSGNINLIENDSALLPALIAKSSSIVSPFIYCVVNRRFRADFLRTLCCGLLFSPKQQRPKLQRNVVNATPC